MEQQTIRDGDNEIIVYTESSNVSCCMVCGEKVALGFTESGYGFLFCPEKNTIHQNHYGKIPPKRQKSNNDKKPTSKINSPKKGLDEQLDSFAKSLD